MRDGLLVPRDGLAGSGTTPAYAGRTRRRSWMASRRTDNPRVCGTDRTLTMAITTAGGQPPRMRDGPPAFRTPARSRGTTPAYAGRTRRNACRRCRSPGQPPRMRDGHSQAICLDQRLGTTPAYAGRTFRLVLMFWVAGDNPRVCGTDTLTALRLTFRRGQPPRMRDGLPPHAGSTWVSHGTTPAYAGRTPGQPTRPRRLRDNPRVCGTDFGGIRFA